MPEFETFDKSVAALGRAPTVTVHKRGTITLNAASYAALGSPSAVELLFDRNAQILGLRAVGTGVRHAAFVRPSHKSGRGPYLVSAMAFVKHYGIDTTSTRRWTARRDGDTILVDLSTPGEVVSRVRAASGRLPRAGAEPTPRRGRTP